MEWGRTRVQTSLRAIPVVFSVKMMRKRSRIEHDSSDDNVEGDPLDEIDFFIEMRADTIYS